MRHSFVIGSLGVLFCLPPAPQIRQDKADKFVLEAGEHRLLDLIERSGQFLERLYLVDKMQQPELCNADAAAGKLMIQRRLELDRAGCEEVVGQLLHTRGWIAVPTDAERGIYDWIYIAGPRAMEIRKHVHNLPATEVLARPQVSDYVATTVALKHANAQLASANLRQFFADPRGFDQIIPLGGNSQRSLMIVGMRPQVASILQIVKEIDIEEPEAAPYLEQRLQNIEARLGRLEAALKQDKR